jgi:hypothetical protein
MNRRTIACALALTTGLVMVSTSTASARTLDDRFAHMARTAPAFGGMFIDDGGVLNVYMMNRSSSAKAAASRALRGNFDLPRKVRVLKARYRFAQLKTWQNRATEKLLGLPGVVMTDVDDKTNRLTVGVTGDRGRAAVNKGLARLGIPRAAVDVQAAAPAETQSSLNDFHRPLVGGLQVGSFGPCTLGFIAIRKGASGFIVNSHCTNIQGSIEGSVFYQPDPSSAANRVGVEAVDPVYFRGGFCFPGRRCRFSDTAFVKRDSGVATSLGFIAKSDPSPSTGWNGDLYRITAKADAIVGTIVEKVGRTTGRSAAVPVDQTCVNVVVNFTNITLLCQNTAQLFSQPGDSGSPVFTPNGSDVTVRGELWGGNVSSGQTIFSPISSIQRSTEMGPISLCAPGFSC